MTTSASDSLPRNRRTGAFERRVDRALRSALGFRPQQRSERLPERLVVAVSGGPDSIATLVACARLAGIPECVVAAYFDHAIRPLAERRAERQVVEQVASALGVGMRVGTRRGALASASEASSREARYRWLARTCGRAEATICVTGHTLDDQAETVLMRLARGTGSLGAAGMQPMAPWPLAVPGSRDLTVLRPLLNLSRADIDQYLVALGIEAAHDPSNDSLDYTRNRVRHEVMPALKAINPRVREHLAAFAEVSRADEAVLSELAQRWLTEHRADGAEHSQMQAEMQAQGSSVIGVPRQALHAAPPAIAMRVIRDAAGEVGMALESAHLAAVQGILGRSGARVDLPGGVASTSRALLWVTRHGG